MTDVSGAASSSSPGLAVAEAPTLSWRAIIAGAFVTGALTLIWVAFGSAIGFSSVSPWPNAGVSVTTFEIGTGLYLIVVALLSSTVGGYIAGRLRHRWSGLHTYETQFRDTAHGFLAWAVAMVVGAAALGGAATFLAGGAAAGNSSGNTSQATAASAPSDYYADMLFRPPAGRTSATRAERSADAAENREARLILTHDLATGSDFPAADRTYLAQLVTARTGLSQTDAEKRVTSTVNQAKAALDRTRKAAAGLSIWLAISMLVGAFASSLAALEGGQLRDRRWKGVIGTRAYREARIEG
jgi:hypothetical protein